MIVLYSVSVVVLGVYNLSRKFCVICVISCVCHCDYGTFTRPTSAVCGTGVDLFGRSSSKPVAVLLVFVRLVCGLVRVVSNCPCAQVWIIVCIICVDYLDQVHHTVVCGCCHRVCHTAVNDLRDTSL